MSEKNEEYFCGKNEYSIGRFINAYLEFPSQEIDRLRIICRKEALGKETAEDEDIADIVHNLISEGCIDFLRNRNFSDTEICKSSNTISDFIAFKSNRFTTGNNELGIRQIAFPRQNPKSE